MGTLLEGLRTDTMVRLALAVLLMTACGGDVHVAPDGNPVLDFDAAPSPDAGQAFPTPGFGTISGECNVLDDELTSSEPSIVRSVFTFDRMYEETDLSMLTAGGQQIIADGNAGGSSVLSEAFAFEMLSRCESASLLKTETFIEYDVEGSLTDFLAEIDSEKIGVSVTRAVAFPFEDPYQVSQATELLSDKLIDVQESTANVALVDRWQKQILAVLAYSPGHADAIAEAWMQLDSETRADTVVHVMVTNGSDDFIYCNGPCQSAQ